MSTQAKVDLRDVIKSFNQSPYSPFKIDPNTANFGNLECTLTDVEWSNNTFDASGFNGQSKTVEVNTTIDTNTKVSASPDKAANSYLTITTGGVKRFGSPNVRPRLLLPGQFKGCEINIDLTKDVHKFSKDVQNGHGLCFEGPGKASVSSQSSVFQGSFVATACVTGLVTSKSGQGNIQEMARESVPAPFFHKHNALCWRVTGYVDLLLETIYVFEAN